MPPIRTFKSAPINPHSTANNPPSTTATEQQQQAEQGVVISSSKGNEKPEREGPAWAPATPTSATTIAENSNNISNYPAARPGALAIPAPTSSPSTSTSNSTPPAPQPGSRPVPPSSSSPSTSTPSRPANNIPPPPKVGEPIQQASYYAPPPQSQATIPTQGQRAVPNSTSTPYLSTYQPPTSTAPYTSTPGLPLSQPETSQGNTTATGGSMFDASTGQDILNTAKSWMASAGSKLAEAEEEVWRIVNKKS
ncbi:conserved hypothetical protein [Talaromyces stipitatus ATCC 10500]|uniref:Uncharacterized protein n=1 Tax=Talaromyces stipitatus (strain ATCC 10500 / CBS 375.48 / QM 6759 / NRRL 1006) TaxID=441959 RepID=B8M5Z0_TALSN|nr:uncharacterized protein TSTA_033600 [Talaromyces stipitatus ATCC 10500]EED20117.1 conserved hypothetical protein [Talaromyces stipitatus ATCC 10500]